MQMRLISGTLALLWAVATPAAQDDARTWIARMNQALATRSYDGWFKHWVGGQSETLRIIHRMRDGQMAERLMSTDGSGREFVRNGAEWIAYFPDKRVAVVETRNRSFGFIETLNGLTAESDKFYVINVVGTESLLGRRAQVISVAPRDSLRYGYRFWLDEKNGMPVKTQLLTRAGEIVEEIAFVSLSLPESISDDLLKPDVDTTGFRWMRRDVPVPVPMPAVSQAFAPRDSLLPAGFRVLNFEVASPDAPGNGPRTRFIVSDGIAWVSVFVETADEPRAVGPVQMGTSATYVTKLDRYYITVVGEVPPMVVKTIAEAVRPE